MVKIDIDTGKILSEDFFEYTGPLALCQDFDDFEGGGDLSFDDDSGFGGGGTMGGFEDIPESVFDDDSGFGGQEGGEHEEERMQNYQYQFENQERQRFDNLIGKDTTEGQKANTWLEKALEKMGFKGWKTGQKVRAGVAVLANVIVPGSGIIMGTKLAAENFKSRIDKAAKEYKELDPSMTDEQAKEYALDKVAEENTKWSAAWDEDPTELENITNQDAAPEDYLPGGAKDNTEYSNIMGEDDTDNDWTSVSDDEEVDAYFRRYPEAEEAYQAIKKINPKWTREEWARANYEERKGVDKNVKWGVWDDNDEAGTGTGEDKRPEYDEPFAETSVIQDFWNTYHPGQESRSPWARRKNRLRPEGGYRGEEDPTETVEPLTQNALRPGGAPMRNPGHYRDPISNLIQLGVSQPATSINNYTSALPPLGSIRDGHINALRNRPNQKRSV